MPKYAIVIEDPEKHRAAAIERHTKHNEEAALAAARAEAKRDKRAFRPVDAERVTARTRRRVEAIVGPPQPAGTLHTIAESECPDGLPNCENCGDPDFAESCKAAGHCPHCGTRHGIAPRSYLDHSGVSVLEIPPPPEGQAWHTYLESTVWDASTRTFKARTE